MKNLVLLTKKEAKSVMDILEGNVQINKGEPTNVLRDYESMVPVQIFEHFYDKKMDNIYNVIGYVRDMAKLIDDRIAYLENYHGFNISSMIEIVTCNWVKEGNFSEADRIVVDNIRCLEYIEDLSTYLIARAEERNSSAAVLGLYSILHSFVSKMIIKGWVTNGYDFIINAITPETSCHEMYDNLVVLYRMILSYYQYVMNSEEKALNWGEYNE